MQFSQWAKKIDLHSLIQVYAFANVDSKNLKNSHKNNTYNIKIIFTISLNDLKTLIFLLVVNLISVVVLVRQ